MDVVVTVQEGDFDATALQAELTADRLEVGSVASFVGLVRSQPGHPVTRLELEHYPGMTERSIVEIVGKAAARWEIQAARVVHRIGVLQPGDQIVYVGVASGHRGDAFQACEFIMDFLKTEAPFWKKESTPMGDHWVDARGSDCEARDRWQRGARADTCEE